MEYEVNLPEGFVDEPVHANTEIFTRQNPLSDEVQHMKVVEFTMKSGIRWKIVNDSDLEMLPPIPNTLAAKSMTKVAVGDSEGESDEDDDDSIIELV